jgi:uncharacterized protein YndB with AHSA1/START domain
MSKQNLVISFQVEQTPQEVFDAITNVRGWWSEGVQGETKELGDEFTYRHKDLHYSRHRLTEVVPGKKVVWLTTESQLNFVDHKDEWTGTEVLFQVTEEQGQTTVEFTHVGLVPKLECFKACTGGWEYYITDSLRNLIVSGKGEPDPVEV